jgi:hypothetical protein
MKNVLNLIKHLYEETGRMDKSQGGGEEYLHLYVPETSTQVRLSSQDGNMIKVTFIESLKGPRSELKHDLKKSPKESDKEPEEQRYIYQLGSVYESELKAFLDKIYDAREKEDGVRSLHSSEEHLYNRYIPMFKSFLKNEQPEGFTLVNKKEGKYEEWKIREESTGLIHEIYLGAAIENGSLPKTVLGSMKIMVRIDVNQPMPLSQVDKDNTTRCLYLDIPGYQLNEYPVLMNKNVKDPSATEDEQEFLNQLKNAATRSLSSKMQYMILNEEMKEKYGTSEENTPAINKALKI